jgi:hypothetical protein
MMPFPLFHPFWFSETKDLAVRVQQLESALALSSRLLLRSAFPSGSLGRGKAVHFPTH